MKIRIVRRPEGEAPEHVRDAWIGLLLPLVHAAKVDARAVGVLSGPRTWWGQWFKWLFGSLPTMRGYIVQAEDAFRVLEAKDPATAAWWRTNTPHLFKPGARMVFDEGCCLPEEVDRDDT